MRVRVSLELETWCYSLLFLSARQRLYLVSLSRFRSCYLWSSGRMKNEEAVVWTVRFGPPNLTSRLRGYLVPPALQAGGFPATTLTEGPCSLTLRSVHPFWVLPLFTSPAVIIDCIVRSAFRGEGLRALFRLDVDLHIASQKLTNLSASALAQNSVGVNSKNNNPAA
jgi:hypothetical protein